MRGALNGFISTEGIPTPKPCARAKEWPGLLGVDYVKEVTHKEPFLWDEEDEQSARFHLARGAGREPTREKRANRCRRRTFPSSPTITG